MVVDDVPVVIEVVRVVVHAIRGIEHRTIHIVEYLTTVYVWVYIIAQFVCNLVWEKVAIVIGGPLEESELCDTEVCYPQISVVLHLGIRVGHRW